MYLEQASKCPPLGLVELLNELGDGESGFTGTSFGRGSKTLDAFLQSCCDGMNAKLISPKFVPQTIFWMIDGTGNAVGMMRVRHCLTERLLETGGHVGYYVCRSQRQQGYATQALRYAIEYLRGIGVTRVLVTVNPANTASIRVVIANGGQIDRPGRNPDSGESVNRYWIESS